jgi:Cu+-exporting ATPase
MKQAFEIKGMSCAACSSAIERGIGKMEGVLEVHVNLLSEKMEVVFEDHPDTIDQIIKKVDDIGYEASVERSLEEVNVPIDGMTCASCSVAIERNLRKRDGVSDVSVNLTTGVATIKYDQQEIRLSEIKKSIEDLGYEPMEIIVDNEVGEAIKNSTYDRMKKDLVWAVIFTFPLLYIAMAPMLGLPMFKLSATVFGILQLSLTLPVLWIGRNFYKIGYKTLIKGNPNMDSLIAVGTTAAMIYSLYALGMILGGEDVFRQQLYFETAATIITLIKFGKFLEFRSKSRTSQVIDQLIKLRPKTAIVITQAGEIVMPISEVQVGDHIRIKPGECIPVDGAITSGHTSIDESMLTGESLPVFRQEGDSVIGGSMNGNGSIVITAEGVGSDSVLSKIIDIVTQAQSKKAPIARLADVISGYFVPIVMLIALLSTIVWFIVTRDIGFSMRIFVSVLVIACPCALGLATPTAIMVGTGRGAEQGILIKGGESLEMMYKVNAVMIDKTGTLTEGRPVVADIVALGNVESSQIVQWTASLESKSEHPLATAIITKSKELGLEILEIDRFENVPGYGLLGEIHGKPLRAGNAEFVGYETESPEIEALFDKGMTVIFLKFDKQIVGAIGISDRVRETSAKAVAAFHKKGIEVIMLTGDHEKAAAYIAAQTGVDKVISGVRPENKAEEVQKLKDSGKVVMMIGDGINDSPALAVADVGIAIGTGTDIAIEAADVVLMSTDLSAVLKAIDLSRKTLKNIKQNLFWAFAYNVMGIPIAAGLLFALGIGPLLNPMFAALAMSLSSVSVVTNALRLKYIPLEG